MKALLLLLLLIPLVYADEITTAREANLEAESYAFVLKMDAAIAIADEKGVNSEKLKEIKASFENSNEEDKRKLADAFREETGLNLIDYEDELKAIKVEDNELNIKKARADELRKAAISIAYDTRIQELNSLIEEKGETKVLTLLLESFEKEKLDVNETTIRPFEKFSLKTIQNSILKAIPFFNKTRSFFTEKIEEFNEE